MFTASRRADARAATPAVRHERTRAQQSQAQGARYCQTGVERRQHLVQARPRPHLKVNTARWQSVRTCVHTA